ncbi:MAG: hypothetical protein KDG52_16825 [Rhodocyclaceae bacterium]|nr:hypothetical protein [Rhodocyclaceae bacterium]
MNRKQLFTALVLSFGLAGTAAAFDTEGDIEDRLLASLGAGTAQATAQGPFAFQSEGDIHDHWFVARRTDRAGMEQNEPTRYAFEDEGDLVARTLRVN